MIRVLPFGGFYNRQPLAYAPIRDRVKDRVTIVDRVENAQIVLFSHPQDLDRHGTEMVRMLAINPNLRLVQLSEEPFWDSCWSEDPFSRYQTRTEAGTAFPYAVLNHQTSGIFRADRIPYFLMTDPRYIAHYRPLFDRNAGFSAADWSAQFRDAELDAAFVGEKRTLPRHSPAFSTQDLWGLSVFRSNVTRTCLGNKVLRIGVGWEKGPARQELPDWHLDKLQLLDLRCRYVSGIENTHQRHYLTEKIFDAFAVGGVPIYFASAQHDVNRLVGAGGWVNIFTRPVKSKAPFDPRMAPTAEMIDDYCATQNRLAELFSAPPHQEQELERIGDVLVLELQALIH